MYRALAHVRLLACLSVFMLSPVVIVHSRLPVECAVYTCHSHNWLVVVCGHETYCANWNGGQLNKISIRRHRTSLIVKAMRLFVSRASFWQIQLSNPDSFLYHMTFDFLLKNRRSEFFLISLARRLLNNQTAVRRRAPKWLGLYENAF